MPHGGVTRALAPGDLLVFDPAMSHLLCRLPVEDHEPLAALDLEVAEFDELSGAIQRVRALRNSMKRSTPATSMRLAAEGASRLARDPSGCEVLERNLLQLELPLTSCRRCRPESS